MTKLMANIKYESEVESAGDLMHSLESLKSALDELNTLGAATAKIAIADDSRSVELGKL